MEGHLKSFSTLVVALALVMVPTFAQADVGDMGMDAGDMGLDASDAGSDMASDMAGDMTSDMAGDMAIDMPVDMQADADTDDAGVPADQGFADTGSDVGPDIPVTFVTFTGEVRLTPDGIGNVTILLIGEGGERFQRQVFSGETFVFEEIPSDTYDVRVTSMGYQTIEETIVMNSNTGRNFELFLDESALLFVDITVNGEFPEPEDPDEDNEFVTVRGTSPRGEFSENVAIEDGMGQITRELGVATWQVDFEADGFQNVTQTVEITTSRESTNLSVHLYQNQAADVRVNENCSCTIASESRTPGMLAIVGLLLGIALWHRRRDQEHS